MSGVFSSITAVRALSFELLIAFCVVIEAITILYVFGEAGRVMQTGDAPLYNRLAANLVQHGVFSASVAPPIEPSLYRLPGYPLFLAAIFSVFGTSQLPVKIIQFMVFGLIAVTVYRTIRAIVDDRTAKVAALLCVIHLPLIFFVPLIQTETLTSFLAMLSMSLLLNRKNIDHPYILFLIIGLCVAMLGMVRPSFALLLIPIGIAIALEASVHVSWENLARGMTMCALLVLGFSLLFIPWLARNYSVSRQLVLSSAGSESLYWSLRQYNEKTDYNLWQQWETQYFPALEIKERIAEHEVIASAANQTLFIPFSVAKELSIDRQWRNDARDEFNDLAVTQVLKKVPGRILALWKPSYIHAPSWLYIRLVQRLPEVQVWAMLGGAILGVWARRRKLLSEWPLWIVPIYLTSVHMVFHLETRYSIPGHTFMLIYAAVGFVWLYDQAKPRVFRLLRA